MQNHLLLNLGVSREQSVLLRDEPFHSLGMFHLLVSFVLNVLDAEPKFLLVAISICEFSCLWSKVKYSLLFDSIYDLRIRGINFGQGYSEVADVAPV